VGRAEALSICACPKRSLKSTCTIIRPPQKESTDNFIDTMAKGEDHNATVNETWGIDQITQVEVNGKKVRSKAKINFVCNPLII
jgi:hypothetical protein